MRSAPPCSFGASIIRRAHNGGHFVWDFRAAAKPVWHILAPKGQQRWRYMPYLSIMFLGTLYRKYRAPYPSAQLRPPPWGPRIMPGIAAGRTGYGLTRGGAGLTHPLRFGAGHALAFVLFAAGIFMAVCGTAFCALVGDGQLLLYLFHPVAMNLVYYYFPDHRILGESRWSLGSYMGITTLLSVGLAAAVYYAIEKPAIRFSHRS